MHCRFTILLLLSLMFNWRLVDLISPSTTTDPRCYRSTNITGPCISMTSNICLGVTLPFSQTSLALANDSNSLPEVFNKLHLWSGLRNVPQCWAVVQPFLCSVYLPRCDDSKGVELPVKELCERTRKPCHIVYEVNKGWPDFLQCDHPHFIPGCKPETYDKLVFNTTGQCEPPLVRTDDPDSWYDGVEGCGVPCDNPLFTKEQHQEVHIFIAVFGSLCLVCTLFTVLTFIIDWRNANHYPAIIIFFINACFFLGSIGWMAQFAGGARKDIVCRKDGTVRKGEPKLGSGESISCTIVFVIVYYFLVAGVSWFVMLAYAWYLTFTALGTPRNRLISKTSYFHLISWCSPLVLTIICLAISEIDGDSMSGICFVGGFNHGIRAMFVLAPVGLVIIVGTFFLLRGVYTLIQIRKEAPMFIPEKTCSKIRDTILRLGIFTTVALAFVFITFAVHVYIFANERRWQSSFRDYMYCLANVSVSADAKSNRRSCDIEHRPSLVAMEIHIFAFFGAGIAMSSWSWTKSSLAAWERFFRWIFHKPSNKPVKLKRHRMIAQAFEKRKEINQGKVCISYCSSHDDPLGMKFDLNNGSDDELSSNFAMAMPKLVRRRGGLIFPLAGMSRRYSDSDVQSVISTRRVSRESQFLEFHESQFVVIERDRLRNDPYVKRSKKKLKKKRGKLNRIRPLFGPMFSGSGFHSRGPPRKGSDSSAFSQMSAQSVCVALKRNSVETVSLESSIVPDTILPAVTKRAGKDTPLVGPRGMFPMFLSGPSTEGSVVGGMGHPSNGMEEAVPLPGAPEERAPSHQDKEKKEGHSFELSRTVTPLDKKINGQKFEVKPEIHQNGTNVPGSLGSQNGKKAPNSSAKHPATKTQHHKVKSSTKSMTRRKSKMFTVESTDLSAIPFSPLMADIGGGNWGVLLGKSGSSSGSEAGGVGHGSYFNPMGMHMGRRHAMDGWSNPPSTSSRKGHSSASRAQKFYPPAYNNYPPQTETKYGRNRSRHEPSHQHYQQQYHPGGGGMPVMGGFDPYMAGVGGVNFMSGHQRFAGGVNPYMAGQGAYTGGANHYMSGSGVRPKIHEDLGHFPTHCYYNGNEVEARHKKRERSGKRDMKRPAPAFFNSTFEVDDDVESISA